MRWLDQIFSRRRRYSDLSESIREHLEEKIEDLMEDGMSREEATRAARHEFGNVTLIEERSREVWQWPNLRVSLGGYQIYSAPVVKIPWLCCGFHRFTGLGYWRSNGYVQRDLLCDRASLSLCWSGSDDSPKHVRSLWGSRIRNAIRGSVHSA